MPFYDMSDYYDELPEFHCENCEHEWRQHPKKSYEDDDADGNRGRYMYCIICPQCDEEYCWYTT